MKDCKYIIASVVVSIGLCACSDDWNSHYSKQETVVENMDIQLVDKPVSEFLQSEPEYQDMYTSISSSYGKFTHMGFLIYKHGTKPTFNSIVIKSNL